ncbi:MAG: hypothetical protein C0518_12025 [Opitutus sp.]|nr:hypothetical protein [Opitutus sp.]
MSLLSLKKRDAAPAVAPAWHPNFRNFERLPDTKVVRTNFFINVAAVALALALGGLVGWREYQAGLLRQQTAAAEARIAAQKKQSDEGLRLTKLFNDEEKKFAEATAFVKVPIQPSEVLALLGESLPAEIQLEYVDVRATDATDPRCTLRGLAAGSKDQASGAASSYVETLRTQPRFAEVFASVNLTTINADARSGMLVFEIVMKFKTAGGKKP